MNQHPRDAYLGASVATASPQRLLVMLVDRLVLDVRRGLDAQNAGDHHEAHKQLLHAQDIVHELRTSLRPDVWDGGPRLAAIYDFLHGHLVRANVRRDPALTRECLRLATDLSNTWRQVADQAAIA